MTTTDPTLGDRQGYAGLAGVPLSLTPLTRKEFTSDAEVRWCPGCGDYSILATFLGVMPDLGITRENTVIVSGIGCSSRFPYYVDSYGLHSIHGRAPAIASGLAITRPDLSVWVVTGDGDALSIGGNHLIHTIRRNINLTILLFNNRIYGLTKGQYSPTSEQGKVTKSTPLGSLDTPFNPLSLALGAEAGFVARAVDSDRAGLTEVLKAAANHRGTALVEILQNCPIFNDNAFDAVKGKAADEGVIPLRHGQPVVFAGGRLGVVRDPATGVLSVAEVAEAGLDNVLVHDAHRADPSIAYALTRLTDSGVLHRAPIGIFRDVTRPAYDDLARQQVATARGEGSDSDGLQRLVTGQETWSVG